MDNKDVNQKKIEDLRLKITKAKEKQKELLVKLDMLEKKIIETKGQIDQKKIEKIRKNLSNI